MQIVVRRALVRIDQDVIGAHQLPESPRGVRIVGIHIGMGGLGGPAKRSPQPVGIIARKGSEQIVERPHGGTRDYFPLGKSLTRSFRLTTPLANQNYQGGRMILIWQNLAILARPDRAWP